jgi:hypothetical protein
MEPPLSADPIAAFARLADLIQARDRCHPRRRAAQGVRRESPRVRSVHAGQRTERACEKRILEKPKVSLGVFALPSISEAKGACEASS